MVGRMNHSPLSAHVDGSRNRGTPTRLFDQRDSLSQRKQHCVNGDLIPPPRSAHAAGKNRNGFK